MLGFDTLWSNDADDEKLAHISQQQTRTLLTRDQGLLKRKDVTRGYWVRSTAPREQLSEVLERFDLYRAATPFTRCMACNGVLRPASLEEVQERLPPRTALYYHEFWQCERCAKVYWEGPHVRRMEKLLQEVLGSSAVA